MAWLMAAVHGPTRPNHPQANSAILNALLTLLNERLFDNGNARFEVPLLCLVRRAWAGMGCCGPLAGGAALAGLAVLPRGSSMLQPLEGSTSICRAVST